MKEILLKRPAITAKFGWKYISHNEDVNGVTVNFADLNGNTHNVRGRYLVGCDGGGSRVRRTAGIAMRGGPMSVFQIKPWNPIFHHNARDSRRR
jgi:FAD-dependent monooxygenase